MWREPSRYLRQRAWWQRNARHLQQVPRQKGQAQKGLTRLGGGGREDEENEEEDAESTGRGRGAPPSYGELSSHFGILERAAQDSGNADAALYLSKARMAMIAAYANKRTRQADLREFVSTE